MHQVLFMLRCDTYSVLPFMDQLKVKEQPDNQPVAPRLHDPTRRRD